MNSRSLIREVYDAFERHDLERLLAFWADDCELVDVPGETVLTGKEALADFLEDLYRALPDVRVEKLRIVADEEAAAVQFHLVGTHNGTFFDRPPSNNVVRWELCSIFDIEAANNLITREAYYYDRERLTRQLEAGE
jgi:steroid delta-isomerase-like uncharacterized protein